MVLHERPSVDRSTALIIAITTNFRFSSRHATLEIELEEKKKENESMGRQ